ncbi:hypothetical protein AAur_pTC10169 (plasmid) [Paenarthrobacter aurescens TC1]|uniref:Uncharacterized protein n=1 Tax=Paenarthrobacter aurescens (strain TC1) TaxID=290340 RepID=A1RCS9_PAEAT|nr:hypothetical protein AAur_pTC10169 [Paenarthrobacter aurescens TC1]
MEKVWGRHKDGARCFLTLARDASRSPAGPEVSHQGCWLEWLMCLLFDVENVEPPGLRCH